MEEGGEPVGGTVEVLADRVIRERLTGIIRTKYGIEYRVEMGIERLLGKPGQENRVILRITSQA